MRPNVISLARRLDVIEAKIGGKEYRVLQFLSLPEYDGNFRLFSGSTETLTGPLLSRKEIEGGASGNATLIFTTIIGAHQNDDEE